LAKRQREIEERKKRKCNFKLRRMQEKRDEEIDNKKKVPSQEGLSMHLT
jgi:hypothetical protein